MKRIFALAALAALSCSLAAAQPQQVFDSATNSNLPISVGSVSHTLSAVSTNATSVRAVPAVLQQIFAVNAGASAAYLKLVDKASAPTCGTDAVVATIPLPVNQPVQFWPPNGIKFLNGIAFCLTGAIADSDTTNTVTGIAVDVIYN